MPGTRTHLLESVTDQEDVEPKIYKRLKIDSDVERVLHKGLLDSTSRQLLATEYKESMPYRHCCIDKLVDDTLLRSVRNEIWANLHFTEKETDIYKIKQTGDLANIDGLPQDERDRLSLLHRLRDALYSPTFRHFISDVTGCGPLSGSKQDMSINSYSIGCHLLNHDDVIGTRRVSYILYLPDPDKEWNPSYGGALELYPCVAKGTPDVAPTRLIPPKFNQFVMFAVQPGYSFHSVQEVVVDEDRLSISGWFHLPQEGEEGYSENQVDDQDWTAAASLNQLKNNTNDHDFPFEPLPQLLSTVDDDTLSHMETKFLERFIHPQYLNPGTLLQINEKFCEESSIQLTQFLRVDLTIKLVTLLHTEDVADCFTGSVVTLKHGVGIRDQWNVYGSPVQCRYMVQDQETPKQNETTAMLHTLQSDLFSSNAFTKFLKLITSLRMISRRSQIRRFRPGLDYTLATSSNESTLDMTLCLTPPHECWENGERGGYECYVAPDEKNDDPAVYRNTSHGEDDGALLTVPASWNMLTIVLRDEGVMRFVKYVSGLAVGSRWDIAVEHRVAEEEEEKESI